MLNIIILGAPGAGKSLQAKKLTSDPDFKSKPNSSGLFHISTGELLREEMTKGTPLGLEISETMNSGQYVSDAFASSIIMNKTDELGGWRADGFVFDGFPRTIPQCEFLDRKLTQFQSEVNAVINIKVDSKTLIARLLERGKTSGRGDDQDRATIVKRLKVYTDEVAPILEYYGDLIIDVDGVGTVDEVYTRIVKALTGESAE